MLRTRRRMGAAILLALLVATVLAGRPLSARAAGEGVTGAGSYESPTFGYELEWTAETWTADESFSVSDEVGDRLRLQTDESVAVVVGFNCICVPQDVLNELISQGEERFGTLTVDDSVAGDDEVAALVTFEMEGAPFSQYMEVRSLGGGAMVAITLTAQDATFEGQMAVAADTILFDGGALFVTHSGAGEREEPSKLDFLNHGALDED